jgi:hypothetical protein
MMARVGISRKDAEIRNVLSWLSNRFGPNFLVVDNWEADRYAIGVAAIHDPKRLVYISSWGRPTGHYSVELETAPTQGSEIPYTSVGKFDNVDRKNSRALWPNI